MKSLTYKRFCLTACLLLLSCSSPDSNVVELQPSIEVVESEAVESKVEIQPTLNLFSGGKIPNNFRLAIGDEVEKIEDSMRLLSTLVEPKSSGRTKASFFIVSKAFETLVRGQKIKISISARADTEIPAQEFGVAYSTAQSGNSGWKYFAPESEFKLYEFTYEVPSSGKEANGDFIGVHASRSGNGQGIEIQSLTIKIIP